MADMTLTASRLDLGIYLFIGHRIGSAGGSLPICAIEYRHRSRAPARLELSLERGIIDARQKRDRVAISSHDDVLGIVPRPKSPWGRFELPDR